ncbi:MAG: DMT family transporter [Anaerolineae bacterium]|nr:DMT family transporter [Anaerolineae bacterium]
MRKDTRLSVTRPQGRRALWASFPLLASAAWGVMYVVSKQSFAQVPPITLCLIRILLGGGALAALSLARGEPLPKAADRRGLLGLGLIVAVALGTQYLGTDLATASQAALITTLTPAFTLLLAWVVGGERLAARTVLGSAAALAGVLLIIAPQLEGLAGGSWRAAAGSLLLLGASFAWGLYTVAGKPLVRRLGALYTTTYSTLASAPFFALLIPLELRARPMGSVTPGLAAAVLYLSFGATALAWYLWNKGIEYADASLVAIFFFAQPVVGALLGWLVLHEALGWRFVVGGLVVAAGIVYVSWPERAGGGSARP